MYEILCEKCNGTLIVDTELTKNEYMEEPLFNISTSNEIIEATINNYLVYRCINCERYFKYTYKEWEYLFRKKLTKEIMELKKIIAYKQIDPMSIDADKGLLHCGKCSGYDGLGNCFKDLYDQCTIRKGV